MVINILFKVSGSKEFSLSVDPEITVLDLKQLCVEHTDIPVDAQRLIFKGKILKDKETLSFYNVTDGSTMHLVRRAAPIQEPEKNEAVEKSENANVPVSTPAANNFNDMTSNSLFQMMMQSGAGAGGLNNLGLGGNMNAGDNMGFGGFSDLMNAGGGMNREFWQNILNSPFARRLMTEMSNNPEILSSVINNTDFLRNTYAQSPIMQQIFENPEMLREFFNPELLQAGLRFDNVMNTNSNLNASTNTDLGMGGGASTGAATTGATTTGATTTGAASTTSNNSTGTTPSFPGANNGMGGLNLEQLLNNLGNMGLLRPQAGANTSSTTTTPSTATSGASASPSFNNINTDSNTTSSLNNTPVNNSGANMNTQRVGMPDFSAFLNNPDIMATLEQALMNNYNMGNLNMGGMNTGGTGINPTQATTDTRPLEEVYESQLKSLQEMGFIDIAANIQALQETGGDINSAVTRLLERGYN